jgi:hypothetical protein
MHWGVPFRSTVGASALPDDLVAKGICSQYAVKHDLKIVTRMGVTMKVQRACRPQNTPHLDNAVPHPVDIDFDAAFPSVLKRPHLGLVSPDHFVVAVREKRWVEVDKVDALVRELD